MRRRRFATNQGLVMSTCGRLADLLVGAIDNLDQFRVLYDEMLA